MRQMTACTRSLLPHLLICNRTGLVVTLLTPVYLVSATLLPSSGLQTTPTIRALSWRVFMMAISLCGTRMETRRRWNLDRTHGDYARRSPNRHHPLKVSFRRCLMTPSIVFGISPFSETRPRNSHPMLLTYHTRVKRPPPKRLLPLYRCFLSPPMPKPSVLT